jgi:Family of unknown function (DUF6084)
MPDLRFAIESAEPVPFAAAPLLALKLRVESTNPEETIHTIALRAQIQIEATRRRYSEREQEKLLDLFGEPDRWSRTLRSMLWTHADAVIPAFTGSTTADLQVPCTFDFNCAATKYFHGVSDGDIPLILLFSGTLFYAGPQGALQVAPISWDKEARYRLPVQVWRDMMNAYYPNSAWLSLRRDVFERVYEYKVRHGIPSWEEALTSLLLAAEGEPVCR